jgi:hypothetical protein
MTTLNVLLWLAVVANLVCMAWNISRARAFTRALEVTAKERAELLVKVNAALAMPPVGQASHGGTTIRARGDSLG